MTKEKLLHSIFPYAIAFLIINTFSITKAISQGAESIPTESSIIQSGEVLFKANCTVCHSIDDKVIGPPLKNVHQRRELSWIIKFVKNSQKVIKSGDTYALELYNQYNQTEMTSFDFSDSEITSIVAYIKNQSEITPSAATSIINPQIVNNTEKNDSNTTYTDILLIALVAILGIILLVLLSILSVLLKYISKKNNLTEEQNEIISEQKSLTSLLKSNFVIGLTVFLFTAIVLKSIIDGLFSIGIQQNYKPTQPIAFSHKLHAGQYKIDCNYCHTSVYKSKNANIPSPNICMNCHGVIQNVGGKSGISPEIKKIYDAVENSTPIEWIRIHNLPDLAYFNHAQHVQVGNVKCQTCHGPIEEMDVVYQYSNLTMGWCINCHRETDINSKGNAYYDNLVKIHNKKSKTPMKVEDIGGLECSKCHY
ncbi:MAG: cytochrome c3 family protein [Chitinophagaceae bacterium]|nr:cytochrome c3 family protein [Chitinophagaceae bacterium]